MTVNINSDLQKILNHWELELYCWEKIRDVYKLYTNQGIKNLKISPLIPARLIFVHQAIKHLIQNGFLKMYPLIPTIQGYTYVYDQQFAYSLFDWIEGRQCNYKDKTELIQSIRVLADFHQKSCGFLPPERSNMRNHLGKCLKHFEERRQDLLRFKDMATADHQGPFTVTYLENIDFFLPMAENAIAKIKKSSYPRLVERAQMIRPFCHGDPAARNFISTPQNEVFIIDFDSCRLDLPIMDLIKFTRRVLKKDHWRYPTAKLLIDSYQAINPLSQRELEVMKAVFYFPQKFWRLAIRYFDHHSTYGQERLLQKFQKYIGHKTNLSQFQNQFEDYQSYGGE